MDRIISITRDWDKPEQVTAGLSNSRSNTENTGAKSVQNYNPYTYTGREDDNTGLLYYRARYYDPSTEVFISQDPLGDAQRYVEGNPIKYRDPNGEFALFLIIAAGYTAAIIDGILVGTSVYAGQQLGNNPELQKASQAAIEAMEPTLVKSLKN